MAFGSLDKRMYRDVRELHDHLWNPRWKGDAQALRVRLAAEAKALDAFLGAGGRLARPAAKLAKASGGGAGGEGRARGGGLQAGAGGGTHVREAAGLDRGTGPGGARGDRGRRMARGHIRVDPTGLGIR